MVFLALIAALALTWFRKRYAMAIGALAAVLAVLDVIGLANSAPAPAAMIVLDGFAVLIGAAIAWAARRVGATSAF